MNADPVEIAKVNAKQAILVAVISAAAGVATTLLGTHAVWQNAVTHASMVPTAPVNETSSTQVDTTKSVGDASEATVARLTAERVRAEENLANLRLAPPPPSITYVVDPYDLTAAVCEDHARHVLSGMQVGVIKDGGPGTFGYTGSYVLSIGCYTGTKVVVFVAGGPDDAKRDELRDRMRQDFKTLGLVK
jgi:hypothetical protein